MIETLRSLYNRVKAILFGAQVKGRKQAPDVAEPIITMIVSRSAKLMFFELSDG